MQRIASSLLTKTVKVPVVVAGILAFSLASAQKAPEPTRATRPVFTDLTAAPATPSVTNSAPALSPAAANFSNATASVSPGHYVADDKYKLRAGDRVSFQILEDRDLPKSLLIADSGELDVPYIGRIMAAEKSCKQLAAELKGLLEKEYYYRASVVLALDAANKFWGRVYVWGQVRNQGPIDVSVSENLTAGKAILRAGGFADFANKKRVKVVHAAVAGAPAKPPVELNMIEILEDGKTDKDLALQPDDSIIVPSRLINF